MLSDQTFFVKAENVERDLLTCTCEIVQSLQENLIAILECTDVVNSGLYRSGSKPGDTAYECVTSCSVSQVVLDIAFRKKRCCRFGIARGESVDKSQCFFPCLS